MPNLISSYNGKFAMRVLASGCLPEVTTRLDSGPEVAYLMFNEASRARSGKTSSARTCAEGLPSGIDLLAAFSLRTPKVHAVVSLFAFQAARLPARIVADQTGRVRQAALDPVLKPGNRFLQRRLSCARVPRGYWQA